MSERGQWTQFYAQVREGIERGAAAPVTASDGREIIRIIEAALLSSDTGQRVRL